MKFRIIQTQLGYRVERKFPLLGWLETHSLPKQTLDEAEVLMESQIQFLKYGYEVKIIKEVYTA